MTGISPGISHLAIGQKFGQGRDISLSSGYVDNWPWTGWAGPVFGENGTPLREQVYLISSRENGRGRENCAFAGINLGHARNRYAGDMIWEEGGFIFP